MSTRRQAASPSSSHRSFVAPSVSGRTPHPRASTRGHRRKRARLALLPGFIAAFLAYATCAYAQVRPVPPIISPPIVVPPIEPPIIRPPPITPPVIPPIATPDARIVTDAGIVVGTMGRASVELPAQTGTSPTPPVPGPRTTAAIAPAYRWTIANGRLLSDPADAVAEFTASTTGTVTLGVSVTAEGAAYSTSTRVNVLPPNVAGAMSVAASVPGGSSNPVTARVPPAVNNDRTFRWSVSDDARIVRGQGTADIAFSPGSPGVREVTCAVTLQNMGTVRLRSYVNVTGNGPPVAVTINQGEGGGTFAAGSRIVIMADPPGPGTVFDRWTGDVGVLGEDPLAVKLPAGTITVPAEPVALTATYKPAAAWTPSPLTDVNQSASATRTANPAARAWYHVPPGASGLVFLLHDTGGTAADWFERADHLLLARDLVEAGLGVAALTSSTRNWSLQPVIAGNTDAQALAGVWERLVREEALSSTQPVFFMGVGSGAQAAARIADVLSEPAAARPIAGAILLCGTGAEDLAALSRVPAMFALAARDVSPGFAGSATARVHADLLAGRGVASNLLETGISPVPARRFLKLQAIDPAFEAAQASEIWAALRSAEALDDAGYVQQILSAEAVRAALPVTLDHFSADVAAQLQAGAGGRSVPSESAARIVEFIKERATAADVREPARVTNISTRSRIAFVSDTFGLGFALAGNERTSVLLRAVGPGLSRFGVANRALATQLEVYRGSTLVATNDGWDARGNTGAAIATAAASVGAFPLAAGTLDSALLLSLEPGSYQVLVKGVNGTTGDVLLEAYDVSRNATRLGRFTSFGRIDDAATESLVTGFVVQGVAPRTLLCRTVGPGLIALGRPADTVMADPLMAVTSAGGRRVAANDNWGDGNAELLRVVMTRAAVAPLAAGSRDAAVLTALQPGAYVIEANGVGAATGEVLIEVTSVP